MRVWLIRSSNTSVRIVCAKITGIYLLGPIVFNVRLIDNLYARLSTSQKRTKRNGTFGSGAMKMKKKKEKRARSTGERIEKAMCTLVKSSAAITGHYHSHRVFRLSSPFWRRISFVHFLRPLLCWIVRWFSLSRQNCSWFIGKCVRSFDLCVVPYPCSVLTYCTQWHRYAAWRQLNREQNITSIEY